MSASRFVASVRHVLWVLRRATAATAVEYAIMLGAIALVIIVAVTTVGAATRDALCRPVDALGDAEAC